MGEQSESPRQIGALPHTAGAVKLSTAPPGAVSSIEIEAAKGEVVG